MSGGYFDYIQYRFPDVINKLDTLIIDNKECEFPYSEETIKKFKEALLTVNRAWKMIHRIDYLVEDDDSEETFHEQWDKEIGKK